MNAWSEEGVVFPCKGSDLVGILHRGTRPRGVLVVVGGPQYRAGSHRQFTLLARRLCAEGYPVFRFDCRGHGDSGGTRSGFESISDDIDAALAQFRQRAPGLQDVVIAGLCDAASAALLHRTLPRDVGGMVLLNPWVTETEVAPETMLRHYYLRRLFSRAFWQKLLGGGVSGAASFREVGRSVASALGRRIGSRPRVSTGAGRRMADSSLSGRMARGLEQFQGPVLLITSGNDLTASEFLDVSRRDTIWRDLLCESRVSHEHLADANHTFSTGPWRAQVESLTVEWLSRW